MMIGGGVLVLSMGVLCAVSYRNTITPVGVIIHHSAVPPLGDGSPDDIRRLSEIHRQRGYGAFYWGRTYHVGYHYVILPDGTMQQGRPERCQGAHARGYNSYLGVCLVGNFSTRDNPSGGSGLTEPTDAQMRVLADLCRQLRVRYSLPAGNIRRHNDVNPDTECPGDRFKFDDLVQRIW